MVKLYGISGAAASDIIKGLAKLFPPTPTALATGPPRRRPPLLRKRLFFVSPLVMVAEAYQPMWDAIRTGKVFAKSANGAVIPIKVRLLLSRCFPHSSLSVPS